MYLSFLKKGAKVRPWIWCIIQLVIALPCSYSKCYGVDLTVSMVPEEGVITLEHGKPLEIYCTAEENYTSSDISFTDGDTTLYSEVVNSTTRRLYLPYIEKQTATYYCKNNKNQRFCYRRVIVDSSPEDVTDFKCISHNFQELNCSFTTPKLVSRTNYNLSFSVDGNNIILNPPCVATKIPNTNTRYCFWDTVSTKPRYRQSEETLNFHLVAENLFGSSNQNFVIDHYGIIKPDPPVDLRMTRNGFHNVTLFWDLPNRVKDFLLCGVNHIIEYIAKIDNRTKFQYAIETKPTKATSNFTYELNLPYPHAKYEVRVYIKSVRAVEREYWSDFSSIVFVL